MASISRIVAIELGIPNVEPFIFIHNPLSRLAPDEMAVEAT